MACLLTNGIAATDCGYFVSGLKSPMYLINVSQLSGSGIVASGYTSVTAHTINFEKNTGSFTDELTINGAQKSRTHAISFSTRQKDQATIDVIDELSLGTVVAIVQARNGINYIVGGTGASPNGLEATVATLSSGAAETDNGLSQVTLQGLQLEAITVYTGTLPA